MDAKVNRRFRLGCFTLEAINSAATAYYFNYLFFYMRDHFGFHNRENFFITVVYGFLYTIAAWFGGRFAQKRGYYFSLRVGFGGMMLAMVAGGLAPHWMGFSRGTMYVEFAVLLGWTISMCLTWPTLQALLSGDESPRARSRTAGVYNMVWASAAAAAYLTGGALVDRFHGQVMFWIPAGMHAVQLVMLMFLPEPAAARVTETPAPVEAEEKLPLTPRPIARSRMFLYLAWLANPFAYVGIYGILPVIPQLASRLGLTDTTAGLVCSVWFWVRLGAFAWLWLWPGWHYRFGWLFGAFVALILSFMGVLLGGHVWTLVVAQIVFGLAVSLIYYSSLFYSMDVGVSKGKSGGIHEAAIGLGTFLGPAMGMLALEFMPGYANAGAWSIGGLLLVGLGLFLWLRQRLARA